MNENWHLNNFYRCQCGVYKRKANTNYRLWKCSCGCPRSLMILFMIFLSGVYVCIDKCLIMNPGCFPLSVYSTFKPIWLTMAWLFTGYWINKGALKRNKTNSGERTISPVSTCFSELYIIVSQKKQYTCDKKGQGEWYNCIWLQSRTFCMFLDH